MPFKISSETRWLVTSSIIIFSIFLRWSVSIYPYSGANTPPQFGDYEAQRHWMEITVNLPTKDWYVNTTDNDLNYWGLDYPPLSAYHSYLCGLLARFLNEDYVKLRESRGYESESHKIFMRTTVLITDLLIYIPALWLYYKYYWKKSHYESKKQSKPSTPTITPMYRTDAEVFISVNNEIPISLDRKQSDAKKRGSFEKMQDGVRLSDASLNTLVRNAFIMAVIYPGLILIDYGHFQYNCASLGLMIIAVTFILYDKIVLAAILFVMALNFKQMELYHSLPFFFMILNRYVIDSKDGYLKRVFNVVKVGLVVILTFFLLWLPFLMDKEVTKQLVARIFPVQRGIFEDKVSNFWCVLNIFYKIKTNMEPMRLTTLCFFTTLLSVTPSCLDLLAKGSKRKFILSLINSSLGFFLFSYHVHEKSILLATVPILMQFHYDPFACFWFLTIATFSMLPLLIKDGLVIPFIALSLVYTVVFRLLNKLSNENKLTIDRSNWSLFQRLVIFTLNIDSGDYNFRELFYVNISKLLQHKTFRRNLLLRLMFIFSNLGAILLFLMAVFLEPPERYPFLFPLLISAYSFVHFLGFFVYFNYCQIFFDSKIGSKTKII